jgi:hypothetical protein
MTRSHPVDRRSQRDELERLQEELRDARQRREGLLRENAELSAQVSQLEEKVRSLQKARDTAYAEWSKPPPSLPDPLVPPFCVMPSRRTVYGRVRLALGRDELSWLAIMMCMYFTIVGDDLLLGKTTTVLFLGSLILWPILFHAFSRNHRNEDERLAWSFDEEGFGPIQEGNRSGKLLYSELRDVEVEQEGLGLLWGVGSVRVTWSPTQPTSLGNAVADGLSRRVDIGLIDDPQRLSDWLLERMKAARKEKPEGAHAS